MVIFLKGALDVLDYFVDEMSKDSDAVVLNLRDAKASLERLSELDKDIDDTTIVITFNCVGTNLVFGGRPYWKAKEVRLFNILVDHPVYYVSEILRDFYFGYHAVCIDRGHAEFLRKILPNGEKSSIFIPHGGKGGFGIPFKDRGIDVLYAGSFHPEDEINFPVVPGVDSERFYEDIIDYYSTHDYVEVADAVSYFMEKEGMTLDAEKLINLSYYAICTVETFFTTKRRKELIAALAGNGITVTLLGGDCWNELATQYPDTICYKGFVDPETCIKLMGQTKILINDLPFFSQGAHERVFNGMLNNALVFSNHSHYLEERFEPGKEMIFWDGKDTLDAVSKIRYLLDNPSEIENIVECASTKIEKDTWKDRFLEILSFKG